MNILINQIEHRSWIEIDTNQLKRNLEIFKKSIPSGKEIMAVIKADAYGHGDIQFARILSSLGIHLFAVSNIDEAIGLREAGIQGEILILGYSSPIYASTLLKYDLTQTIVSEVYAKEMIASGVKFKCQIAIDTGMNRIGIDGDFPERCSDFIHRVSKDLNLTGILSHLCAADVNEKKYQDFTLSQIQKFSKIADSIKDLHLPYIHCMNSAGAIYHQEAGLNTGNVVRLGIILYGLKPDISNFLPVGIKPLMSWYSTISLVKDVRKGEYIGYGLSFEAHKDMKVATITTGYADGYSRHFSNKGFVMIKGHKANICGKVCMDQLLVDVTDIPDIKMGDKVVIMGNCGELSYTAEDMAEDLGTISYEVVCNIAKRVQRFYRASNSLL